jgi:hypothetical protein
MHAPHERTLRNGPSLGGRTIAAGAALRQSSSRSIRRRTNMHTAANVHQHQDSTSSSWTPARSDRQNSRSSLVLHVLTRPRTVRRAAMTRFGLRTKPNSSDQKRPNDSRTSLSTHNACSPGHGSKTKRPDHGMTSTALQVEPPRPQAVSPGRFASEWPSGALWRRRPPQRRQGIARIHGIVSKRRSIRWLSSV